MAQLVSISKTLQLKKDATINEFSTWSIRYRALATNQKFADIMLGRETKPIPVDPLNVTSNEQALLDTFMKTNDDGFSHQMGA